MAQSVQSLPTLDALNGFIEIMAHPERMGLKVEEIADKFKIKIATVYTRLHDPEIDKAIKQRRASHFKIELPNIDKALRKRALKGDVKATELIYERWDDYDPKHNQANTMVNIQFVQKDGEV